MDEESSRPQFSSQQVSDELARVSLVDDILATRGALSLAELVAHVETADKRGDLFPSPSSLKGFLQSRTNAFRCNQQVSDKIRNRSLEYREALGYLVNMLRNACATGSESSCAFVARLLEEKFAVVKQREIGGDGPAIMRFLNEHKAIFIMEGAASDGPSRPVRLHPLCRSIPSVWERDALPTYGTSLRYDRSIEVRARALVRAAVRNTNYAKLELVEGPFQAHTVYCLGKNVKQLEENIAVKYPVGTYVNVIAHRVYNAAQPWTAIAMSSESCDRPDDIWLEDVVASGVGAGSTRAEEVASTSNGDLTVPPRPHVNGTVQDIFVTLGNRRLHMGDILRRESQRIAEIDACLDNGPQAMKDVFMQLLNGRSFSYYSQMVEFVNIRQHLYELKRDGLIARARSASYRISLIWLLKTIASHRQISISALRSQAKARVGSKDEDVVHEAAMDVQDWERFLVMQDQIIEITELLDGSEERFLRLRGTFHRESDTFIPRLYFSFG